MPQVFLIAAAFFVLTFGLPTRAALADDAPPWPTEGWPTASPASLGMDAGLLAEATSYAQAFGGAGIVVRQGHVVASWGDQRLRYDLKSTTKSIGATAVGLGMADGLVTLADRAVAHMPAFGTPPSSNAASGWLDDITLLQLATHTAGFAKPGGYVELQHEPGTAWSYSDGGFNWLADVLTTRFGEDLNSLLFRRVFSRLGITSADLVWRSHAYREGTLNGVKRREFGSGIKANADAMARIGYLYLRGGVWDGDVILPPEFVEAVRQPSSHAVGLPVVGGSNPPGTSSRYGVAWFTNSDGALPDVPLDAYWAWGLLDSLIVVIPSLDIVVARTGSGLGRTGWNADYAYIAPFITPIARSAAAGSADMVVVPEVIGLALADAVSALHVLGLNADPVDEAPSTAIPAGAVIAQNPPGATLVSAGSNVGLTVAAESPDPPASDGWLQFDGINDVVSVPNSATLKVSGAMSIEARIRPRTLATNKQQDRILRKGVDYELMVSTNSAGCAGGTRGSLQLSVTAGGVARKVCGGSLTLGAWQHVAGTYDGAALALYIDGIRVAGLPVTGAIKRSSTLVTIGNVKALSRSFDGGMADFAIWRRALTPEEVNVRANGPLTGSEPGLVSYWTGRGGSGQTIRDATNANHGKLGLSNSNEASDPSWAR